MNRKSYQTILGILDFHPHLQIIQDLDEFDSSADLEKCSIASLAQQWMLCSEWVPSEWVQTADKNITIIHK